MFSIFGHTFDIIEQEGEKSINTLYPQKDELLASIEDINEMNDDKIKEKIIGFVKSNTSLKDLEKQIINILMSRLIPKHVSNIISRDICDLKKTKQYAIEIMFEKDPLDLTICMKGFKNKLDYKGLTLNIKMQDQYPILSPSVQVISPYISLELYYKINNLRLCNKRYWTKTRTLVDIIDNIFKLIVSHKDIEISTKKIYDDIHILISSMINYDVDDSDGKEYVKESFKKNEVYGADGIGYSTIGSISWDIDKYTLSQKDHQKKELKNYKKILKHIKCMDIDYVIKSPIPFILTEKLIGITFFEIYKQIELYEIIFKIIKILCEYSKDILLINHKKTTLEDIIIGLNKEYVIIKKEKSDTELCILYEEIYTRCNNKKQDKKQDKKIKKVNSVEVNYFMKMKKYQLSQYATEKYSKIQLKNTNRIIKELASISNASTVNYNGSIFVKMCENNISQAQALITGPKNTPYENACYIFLIEFPYDYPENPPKVICLSTYDIKINPNIYPTGKICSSLLGTYKGRKEDNWNPEISTLMQVLISIQSLIFCEEPWFNEEGRHCYKYTPRGKSLSTEYNLQTRSLTITNNFMLLLKNIPEIWKSVIHNHIFLKKDDIMETANLWYEESITHGIPIKTNKDDFMDIISKIKYIEDDDEV